MPRRNIFLFVVFFVALFFVQKVFAANAFVRVNELAWMGTELSSNDEWIELYNESGEEINLQGWILAAMDGSPKILLEGSVDAGGYFLLERTDDESVGGIAADQVYSGALSNSGEILVLKNQEGDELDRVDAGGGWLAGDKGLKLTMERKNDGAWQNSAYAGGTPKIRNSEGGVDEEVDEKKIVLGEEEGESTLFSESDDSIQLKAEKLGYDYKKTIVISEVFPSPYGGHSDLEYIELYNYGEEDINLRAWEIGDESVMRHELGIKKDDSVIESGKFFVIYRSESRIALNNSGDKVKLYQPFMSVSLTELEYGSAAMGISFALVDFDLEKMRLKLFDYEWNKNLSPGKINFFEKKNFLPLVDFVCPDVIKIASPQIFDSSDTVDADGDTLKFFWEFGDGATNTLPIPEHTFFEEGEFEVKFTVFDGEADVVKKKMIKVVDDSKPVNQKPIKIVSETSVSSGNEKELNFEVGNVLFDDFEKKEEYIFDVGSRVTILGIVAVLPGVLGAQFFYILESEESSVGIQVYNYKKDFPDSLKIGDLIEVVGEIVDTQGEKRIKTKTKDDMLVVSSGHSLLSQELIIKEIDDKQVGNLITVSGEIVEQKSSYVYVDDGSDEIKVYVKKTTGINTKLFKEGQVVTVTGILGKTKTGLRLMPRFLEDISFFEEDEDFEEIEEFDGDGQVLGETFEKDEWCLESRDQKEELFRYLLVVCGVVISILLILLFRAKK